MELALVTLVFTVAVIALVTAVRRWQTLCVLDVVDGVVTITRGGLPPSILSDVKDVAKRRPKMGRARITVRREGGRAYVRFRGGVTDAQAQQIRNVIGSVPLARLRACKRR